jgi:hypothetical protein
METQSTTTQENLKYAGAGAVAGGLITLLITKGKAMWNYMTTPSEEKEPVKKEK